MRLSFGLEHRQLQVQKLAPRMIQSMEILQLPLQELQERIEQELVENPALALQDYLMHQLGELDTDPALLLLCERIISTLDPKDGGYFRASLRDLLPADATPEQLQQAEKALALVQSLDPPGIAARDLRECLLAQLHPDMDYYEEMRTLIARHLEDLRDNRLPLMQQVTGY